MRADAGYLVAERVERDDMWTQRRRQKKACEPAVGIVAPKLRLAIGVIGGVIHRRLSHGDQRRRDAAVFTEQN